VTEAPFFALMVKALVLGSHLLENKFKKGVVALVPLVG
jgi:hypothetical protein